MRFALTRLPQAQCAAHVRRQDLTGALLSMACCRSRSTGLCNSGGYAIARCSCTPRAGLQIGKDHKESHWEAYACAVAATLSLHVRLLVLTCSWRLLLCPSVAARADALVARP